MTGRLFVPLVVVLAFVASGCGQETSAPQSGAPGGAPTARKFRIGFSQCNLAEPWRVAMNNSLAAEAKKHPELDVLYADAQQDNARQVSQVEDFLTQKVDLLIISPNEAKPLSGVVRKVYEAGIPVIVLDRNIEGDTYTTHIGADNVEIGREAGEYIVKTLNGKGKVVELWGLPGSPPAQDRHQGFAEAIAKAPGIQVVHRGYARWLRDEARTEMERALTAQPKIDLVYAHNDPMAVGAYLAARAARREKEIKFIGIDGLPGPDGGCKMVLDGKLEATFLYPNCGKEAIQTAVKILNGEKVPKRIVLPTATITKENAAEYMKG